MVAWFARTDLGLLFLSALTIGELRYGIALLKERKKRVALERWLASEVLLDFEGRVLPIDGDGADQWGQLRARAKMAGRAITVRRDLELRRVSDGPLFVEIEEVEPRNDIVASGSHLVAKGNKVFVAPIARVWVPVKPVVVESLDVGRRFL